MASRIGPKSRIKAAIKQADRNIRDHANRGGHFAAGLASEGYDGGYAQALMDVLLVLNGVRPGTGHYWDDWNNRPAGTAGEEA